jgi:hypothetical protein
MEGLTDRSRRPYRHANRLPFQVEKLIVQLKKENPSWGAPKIREKLKRLHSEISPLFRRICGTTSWCFHRQTNELSGHEHHGTQSCYPGSAGDADTG